MSHIVSFEISAAEIEVRSPDAIEFDAYCVEIERAEIEDMMRYEDRIPGACVFCGGRDFIDHGSYSECATCGAI